MKTNILNYINKLQAYKTAIKNLHWSSKHMSEHKLLDEIADSVANNQDEIAEMCQGLYGKIKLNELKPKRYKITNSKKMLFDLLRDTKSFNSSIKGRELTGVRSVVEAFIGEINKFVYLMDMCIKEDIKRNFKSSLNESNSIINETLLRETIQKAIKKSLNEWEDPFDETNLENIPTWQTLKNIDEKLFDCYLYNEKDECVGKLGDLHFIYSPKQNKLI
jgi:DNA-binding ferritin-like protein